MTTREATTTASMRLPAALVIDIDRMAADEDRDRTGMVRVLLREALAARQGASR